MFQNLDEDVGVVIASTFRHAPLDLAWIHPEKSCFEVCQWNFWQRKCVGPNDYALPLAHDLCHL